MGVRSTNGVVWCKISTACSLAASAFTLPVRYIPGYTGHLPLNRERFGINYREASADTIAMQKKKGVHNPVVPLDKKVPNHFGDTKPKPLNRSQLFVPADQVAQEEATEDQQQYMQPHAQGPYGVYPTDTWVGKMDFGTTSERVCPNNKPDDPSSLASRIAHRRVARTSVISTAASSVPTRTTTRQSMTLPRSTLASRFCNPAQSTDRARVRRWSRPPSSSLTCAMMGRSTAAPTLWAKLERHALLIARVGVS